MRYHKAHLTRRLILDTTTDSEKEENMVDMLREVGMPADFVNKLARMFQDIKVSQDLNQQFKEQCRAAIADSINIKVVIHAIVKCACSYLRLVSKRNRKDVKDMKRICYIFCRFLMQVHGPGVANASP